MLLKITRLLVIASLEPSHLNILHTISPTNDLSEYKFGNPPDNHDKSPVVVQPDDGNDYLSTRESGLILKEEPFKESKPKGSF